MVVNCGLARRSRSSCSSSSCVSTGHDLVDPGGIYLIAVQERITTQQQYFEEWATLQDELKIEAEARLAEKRRAAGATDEDDLTDGRGVDGEEEEEGEPRHAAVAWTPFLQQLDEATQRSSPPSPRSALGPSPAGGGGGDGYTSSSSSSSSVGDRRAVWASGKNGQWTRDDPPKYSPIDEPDSASSVPRPSSSASTAKKKSPPAPSASTAEPAKRAPVSPGVAPIEEPDPAPSVSRPPSSVSSSLVIPKRKK